MAAGQSVAPGGDNIPLVVVEETLHFQVPVQRLWPLLADSSLLAEMEGRAPYTAIDELQPDGTVIRRAKGRFGMPMDAEWTEDLGEWVEHRYVRQFREFTKGGFHHVDYVAEVSPTADGFDLHVRIEMHTRGAIAWIGTQLGMVRRGALKVVALLEELLQAELKAPAVVGDDPQAMPYDHPPLPAEARRRLDEALAAIEAGEGHRELCRKLDDYLSRTPDVWLQRIRPLALARRWQAEPQDVVSLCLAAHHHGLLQLRWEILCPRCRNGKDAPDNLEDLPDDVHCTTCNIDFEQDFSGNVELVFQPEAWLRTLPDGAYCLMGAMSVPHIKVQRHVEPGDRLQLEPPLRPGSYRLRTAQAGQQTDIDWDGEDGFPTILAQGDEILTGRPSPTGTVVLDNQTDRQLTFVIEELAWRQDSLTGDQAIVLPAFRQYCPEQILRPGDDVAIANVVLLFSDLKGSTTMYEALGDGAAYNLVRDHFDYLTAAIEDNGGVLVKTIGDAVMAAFAAPTQGVRAALAMQQGVGAFNQGRADGGIVLKLGLHQGPCIAVTTDGRLDYFGSTVNVTARLEGQSQGHDIVLSDELMSESDVQQTLDASQIPEAQADTVQLRGVEKPVRIWRIELRSAI